MIKREHYISKIREFYDSDLIKIITGIRRCGKSVVLKQIEDEIRSSHHLEDEKILFLNFEDRNVSCNITNSMELIEFVMLHTNTDTKEGKDNPSTIKGYLFFDEIQNLDGWQEACKTLRLHNYSIFITGSNSKLLSSEFTKELSGRYVSFRIRPFVFKELVEYSKELNKSDEVTVTDYLLYGGFPKRLEFNSTEAQLRYLNDLDDTIVINDLIHRYKIRNEVLFKKLVNYILLSNSRVFSAKSIHSYIKQEHLSCSINTIMKYIGYLEEAYLINRVKLYSSKTKKELSFYCKYYDEDVCLNTIRCLNKQHYDITHNMENVVYNELIYRGYEVSVYRDNDNREIDFVACKGSKKYFIQVAYSVVDEKTYNREMEGFKYLDNLNEKILITNDEIDFSTSTVRHIKLKDFLLMEEI